MLSKRIDGIIYVEGTEGVIKVNDATLVIYNYEKIGTQSDWTRRAIQNDLPNNQIAVVSDRPTFFQRYVRDGQGWLPWLRTPTTPIPEVPKSSLNESEKLTISPDPSRQAVDFLDDPVSKETFRNYVTNDLTSSLEDQQIKYSILQGSLIDLNGKANINSWGIQANPNTRELSVWVNGEPVVNNYRLTILNEGDLIETPSGFFQVTIPENNRLSLIPIITDGPSFKNLSSNENAAAYLKKVTQITNDTPEHAVNSFENLDSLYLTQTDLPVELIGKDLKVNNNTIPPIGNDNGGRRASYDLQDDTVIKLDVGGQTSRELFASQTNPKASENLVGVDGWGVIKTDLENIPYIREKKVSSLSIINGDSNIAILKEKVRQVHSLEGPTESQQIADLLKQYGLRSESDIARIDTLFDYMKNDLGIGDIRINQLGYQPDGKLVIFDWGNSSDRALNINGGALGDIYTYENVSNYDFETYNLAKPNDSAIPPTIEDALNKLISPKSTTQAQSPTVSPTSTVLQNFSSFLVTNNGRLFATAVIGGAGEALILIPIVTNSIERMPDIIDSVIDWWQKLPFNESKSTPPPVSQSGPAKTSEETLQERILEITNNLTASNFEELKLLAASIGGNGSYKYDYGENFCGPLSLEILKQLGLYSGDVGLFYQLEPVTQWDRVLKAFPDDKFSITNTLEENHSVGDMEYWKDNPLKVGDFMYLEVKGGAFGYDHMLVVDMVDSQGRAYSTTNHFTIENGVKTFTVDRVLLYDPINPGNPDAMFNRWTDRSLLNVNGNTGTGGFLVIRPIPGTITVTKTNSPQAGSQDLFNGDATYTEHPVPGSDDVKYHIVNLDLNNVEFLVDSPSMRTTTSDFLERSGVDIAINGDGWFRYTDQYSVDRFKTIGYSMADGLASSNYGTIPEYGVNRVEEDILYFDMNNHMQIAKNPNEIPDYVDNAISFPNELIKNGIIQPHPEKSELTPRTALGETADHKLIVVVVEGVENQAGITADELSKLMKELGAVTAVMFDSGSSSTLVIDGQKTIANCGGGTECQTANHLGFILK